jgi:hypothetical protein
MDTQQIELKKKGFWSEIIGIFSRNSTRCPSNLLYTLSIPIIIGIDKVYKRIFPPIGAEKELLGIFGNINMKEKKNGLFVQSIKLLK